MDGGGEERNIFFNDTATTEIYTLSLHDALPISSFLPSTIHFIYNTFYSQNIQILQRGSYGVP